jgi:hypothetical protein
MANSPRVWTSEHFEAGTKYPSARVVDKDGNVLVQADFSGSAVVRVYDLSSTTPSTVVYSNTVAVSSVVYNTLQTWDVDAEGFNFQTSITSNNVAWEGGHTYRISSLLPHSSQGLIPVVHDLRIVPLLSL